MPTEWFRSTNFRAKTLATIANVQDVFDEYSALGFKLSVRQIHYRLVAQGLWPNTDKAYKNLGNIIRKARDAGMLDWDMVEDRERETHLDTQWISPTHIMRAVVSSFKIDKWQDQEWHVEVMVEEKALEGILIPICSELQVMLSPNKGYSSATMMYQAGKRLVEKADEGKQIMIIYLGDHDPSGLDMDNDIKNSLELYSDLELVDVERVALTFEQIERYQPPPNPTKFKDSRAKAYISRYGTTCWELDALEPRVMANLIRNTVLELRNEDLWDAQVERENEMLDVLVKVRDNWEDFIDE